MLRLWEGRRDDVERSLGVVPAVTKLRCISHSEHMFTGTGYTIDSPWSAYGSTKILGFREVLHVMT